MRKIIVSEFVSPDGIMKALHEWFFQFRNEESAKYKLTRNGSYRSDGKNSISNTYDYQFFEQTDSKTLILLLANLKPDQL
jgi:hypothetical protein